MPTLLRVFGFSFIVCIQNCIRYPSLLSASCTSTDGTFTFLLIITRAIESARSVSPIMVYAFIMPARGAKRTGTWGQANYQTTLVLEADMQLQAMQK